MRMALISTCVALITVPALGQSVDEQPPTPEARLSLDRDFETEATSPEPFGAKGQESLAITSGIGFSLESDQDATDVPLNFAYSRFLADDFEIQLGLTLWGHFQDGDDAAGISPGFDLRWHFVNREVWTLYADAGIGVLFTTDDVPDRGTSFNFMPRLGVGGTLRLTDDGLRLVGGIRWHHISNARIEGDERNPDRDGILFYGGVMIPF